MDVAGAWATFYCRSTVETQSNQQNTATQTPTAQQRFDIINTGQQQQKAKTGKWTFGPGTSPSDPVSGISISPGAPDPTPPEPSKRGRVETRSDISRAPEPQFTVGGAAPGTQTHEDDYGTITTGTKYMDEWGKVGTNWDDIQNINIAYPEIDLSDPVATEQAIANVLFALQSNPALADGFHLREAHRFGIRPEDALLVGALIGNKDFIDRAGIDRALQAFSNTGTALTGGGEQIDPAAAPQGTFTQEQFDQMMADVQAGNAALAAEVEALRAEQESGSGFEEAMAQFMPFLSMAFGNQGRDDEQPSQFYYPRY